jgi:hypothetical protein
MMNPQLAFLFYLAAIVCFVLAAFAPAGPGLGRRRAGVGARIGLVPLGLGLWLFPLLWNTGATAF